MKRTLIAIKGRRVKKYIIGGDYLTNCLHYHIKILFHDYIEPSEISKIIKKYINKSNVMEFIILKKIKKEINTKYKKLQLQDRQEIIKQENNKYIQFRKNFITR